MAHAVAVRHTEPATNGWTPVRPPPDDPPACWDITGDGSDAIWWRWLDAPPGTRPVDLDACWYRVDDLGMGIGLYVPRRMGSRAIAVDDEALNVVRLVDLEGWSRSKTGKRLYHDVADPKAAARSQLKGGRAQLAAAGVLPWAAWPSGKLPARWWDEPDTHVALGAWRASAILAHDELRPWTRLARGAATYAAGLVGTLPRLRVPTIRL